MDTSEDDDDETEVPNPLTQPPVLYLLYCLPVLLVASRVTLFAAFNYPTSTPVISTTTNTTTNAVPSTPVTTPRVITSPQKQNTANNRASSPPSSPTKSGSASNGSSNVSAKSTQVTYTPGRSVYSMEPLFARLAGPKQNLFLVVFYLCVGFIVISTAFSWYPAYWIDIPRLELLVTLYLAGVMQDAKNVPGLSSKEKRQRGIVTLQRIAYLRAVALVVLFSDVLPDVFPRGVFDCSLLYVLSKL